MTPRTLGIVALALAALIAIGFFVVREGDERSTVDPSRASPSATFEGSAPVVASAIAAETAADPTIERKEVAGDPDLPRRRIRGRVVDARRIPVAGVEVAGWRERTVVDHALSDAGGRFELEEVIASGPVRTFGIALHASAADGRRAFKVAQPYGSGGADFDAGTLVLEDSSSLLARVVDAGRPVAGAAVRLEVGRYHVFFGESETDESGSVRFDGLPSGFAYPQASRGASRGRATALLPDEPEVTIALAPGRCALFVDLGRDFAPLELRGVAIGEGLTELSPAHFDAGSSLRVRVLAPAGTDPPRIYVRATRLDAPAYERSVNSAGGAEVVLPGLGPGRFRVVAMKNGGPSRRLDREVTVDGRSAEMLELDLR